MSMSVGRPVSPTTLPPSQSQVKVAQPVVSKPSVQTASKPLNTQESFGAARQSVVGKTSETVNPSQGGQQIKQGIEQSDGEQLLEQGQTLMGSTVVKEEFGDGASALPKLSPPTPLPPPPPPPPKVSSVSPKSGGSSITPDMLVQARQNLKPVSQHQVLNLEKADTTVTESSRSVVLKDEGSAFAPERLTAKSTLEIVGHGASDGSSIGGLNPKQLAQKLKQEGITQLAVLDLKSCYSEGFKTELEGALKEAGITVGGIRTYEGQIGISRETGKVLQGVELEQTKKHDGVLGLDQKVLSEIAKDSGFPVDSASNPKNHPEHLNYEGVTEMAAKIEGFIADGKTHKEIINLYNFIFDGENDKTAALKAVTRILTHFQSPSEVIDIEAAKTPSAQLQSSHATKAKAVRLDVPPLKLVKPPQLPGRGLQPGLDHQSIWSKFQSNEGPTFKHNESIRLENMGLVTIPGTLMTFHHVFPQSLAPDSIFKNWDAVRLGPSKRLDHKGDTLDPSFQGEDYTPRSRDVVNAVRGYKSGKPGAAQSLEATVKQSVRSGDNTTIHPEEWFVSAAAVDAVLSKLPENGWKTSQPTQKSLTYAYEEDFKEGQSTSVAYCWKDLNNKNLTEKGMAALTKLFASSEKIWIRYGDAQTAEEAHAAKEKVAFTDKMSYVRSDLGAKLLDNLSFQKGEELRKVLGKNKHDTSESVLKALEKVIPSLKPLIDDIESRGAKMLLDHKKAEGELSGKQKKESQQTNRKVYEAARDTAIGEIIKIIIEEKLLSK